MYAATSRSSGPARVTLGELLHLLPGYSERRRNLSPPELRIVMGRDIDANRSVRWALLSSCERTTASERALLRDGDLLMTTRSADPQVLEIVSPPADAVAGAPFAILNALSRPRANEASA